MNELSVVIFVGISTAVAVEESSVFTISASTKLILPPIMPSHHGITSALRCIPASQPILSTDIVVSKSSKYAGIIRSLGQYPDLDMSEPIPESIPTSQDPRSKRPAKRRALTPVTQQADQVEALFAKPDRDIPIPSNNSLTKKPNIPAPPEIVANVQGSSAGAGSGEFHVYKASRRREYERIKMMDEEVAREKADEEFERKREELRKRDEEKTGKNRKRREKQKKKKVRNDEKGEAQDKVDEGHAAGSLKLSTGPKRENDDGVELPATTAEDVGVIIHDDD